MTPTNSTIRAVLVSTRSTTGISVRTQRWSVLDAADWAGRMQADDEEPQHADEGGLALEEAKPELKKPPLYKVILLNDDYTPMEFVVEVLETFFKLNREQATQIMLAVHTQGKGVCGIYTRDIAETKAAQVNQFARDHQHPLLCEIEASED